MPELPKDKFSYNKQLSSWSGQLPLEIHSQIYSYLDVHCFYAARLVCKWWWLTSIDAITLRRQLQRLPIRQSVLGAHHSDPEYIRRLYQQVSCRLPLGFDHWQCQHDDISRSQSAFPAPQTHSTDIDSQTFPYDGIVARPDKPVNGAQSRLQQLLHDSAQQRLTPATSTSWSCRALSTDDRLLIVACGRTIQLYDLANDIDAAALKYEPAGNPRDSISSVKFEQEESLLRVYFQDTGDVSYLGALSAELPCTRDLRYWSGSEGVTCHFLDSSTLCFSGGDQETIFPVRVAGLHLLQRHQKGFLFAAQHHGGNEGSYYVVGYVPTQMSLNGKLVAAHHEAKLLFRLESFLSMHQTMWRNNVESGIGAWEEMPSAHIHEPHFALSSDGRLLILAEQEKKHVRPAPLTQLFVYRLPSLGRSAEWSKGSLDFEINGSQKTAVASRLGRLPRCIGSLAGITVDMSFAPFQLGQQEDVHEYVLHVKTTEASCSWVFRWV